MLETCFFFYLADFLKFTFDEIVPCKTKRVKGYSKEWFDSVASEGINKIEMRVEKIIAEKKRTYFKTKFAENTGKPKQLRKP